MQFRSIAVQTKLPRCSVEKRYSSPLELYVRRASHCSLNFPIELKHPQSPTFVFACQKQISSPRQVAEGYGDGYLLCASPGMKGIGSPVRWKSEGQTLCAPCLSPRCASGVSVPTSARRGTAKPLSERRGAESPWWWWSEPTHEEEEERGEEREREIERERGGVLAITGATTETVIRETFCYDLSPLTDHIFWYQLHVP